MAAQPPVTILFLRLFPGVLTPLPRVLYPAPFLPSPLSLPCLCRASVWQDGRAGRSAEGSVQDRGCPPNTPTPSVPSHRRPEAMAGRASFWVPGCEGCRLLSSGAAAVVGCGLGAKWDKNFPGTGHHHSWKRPLGHPGASAWRFSLSDAHPCSYTCSAQASQRVPHVPAQSLMSHHLIWRREGEGHLFNVCYVPGSRKWPVMVAHPPRLSFLMFIMGLIWLTYGNEVRLEWDSM